MSQARFFVLDVYPPITSAHFETYSSAIVSAWISNRACAIDREHGALALAHESLAVEGWTVAATILTEVVDAATYADKAEGRQQYRQALLDSTVFNVVRQSREHVGAPASATARRRAFVDALARGAPLFGLADDDQYANCVLATANELVPLWTEAEDAAAWQPDWPGFDVVELGADALERLVEEANHPDELMYLGLGTRASIITFHPADLRPLLKRPSSLAG